MSSALRAAVAALAEGRSLGAEESAAAVGEIMGGGVHDALVGAFLLGLRVKGETAAELVGAARAMRERADRVSSRRHPLVDTCGTGGDGRSTFSISTAAALVAAGAGAAVAKHGNRAASGRFGGADVLERLGVAIDLDAQAAGRCLDEVGMAFLFARRLHPAMRRVAAVRTELGTRTIFNLLGPLTNPAGARRQVVGVSSAAVLGLVAEALAALGCERALVVHGRDGVDEISLVASVDAIELRGGERIERTLEPGSFGLGKVPPEALRAESVEQSAAIVRAVLEGAEGPASDVVLANAAAALYVGGMAATLAEGVERAREAVRSGAARGVLDSLVRVTRVLAGSDRSGARSEPG